MLDAELAVAKDLAQTASKIILQYYSQEIIAEQKLGIDDHYEPVTAADKAASRVIVDGLNAAFPEDAVLSEEEVDDTELRMDAKRVWIVDPIDGTAGFVKKDGDFAVQIGLAVAGVAVLGVVFLPVHQRLYYATKGGGAFVVNANGEVVKVRVSAHSAFEDMTLAFSRNHPSKGISAILKNFRFASAVQRGSIGLKIGLIAEQDADVYIHLSPRTKLWDTCGPQVILEEAGGKLSDLFGQPFRYDVLDLQNHGGIVATNGVSHDGVIAKLRPVLNEIGRLKTTPKSCSM